MDCIKEEPQDIWIDITAGDVSSGVPIHLDSDISLTFEVTLKTDFKHIKEVIPRTQITLEEFLKIIETRNTNG